ncbi:MAG: hypothetical protein ACO4AA_02145 [Aquiluna sp.]
MSDIDMLRADIDVLKKFVNNSETHVITTMFILRNVTHAIRHRVNLIKVNNIDDPNVKMYGDMILSSLGNLENYIFAVTRSSPTDIIYIMDDLLQQIDDSLDRLAHADFST